MYVFSDTQGKLSHKQELLRTLIDVVANKAGMLTTVIDLFSLGRFLPHFKPCDVTYENSCSQNST